MMDMSLVITFYVFLPPEGKKGVMSLQCLSMYLWHHSISSPKGISDFHLASFVFQVHYVRVFLDMFIKQASHGSIRHG